jgi:hypothetical protein
LTVDSNYQRWIGFGIIFRKKMSHGLIGDWRETTRNLKGSSKERNQTIRNLILIHFLHYERKFENQRILHGSLIYNPCDKFE